MPSFPSGECEFHEQSAEQEDQIWESDKRVDNMGRQPKRRILSVRPSGRVGDWTIFFKYDP